MIQGSVGWALLELAVLRALEGPPRSLPALLADLEDLGVEVELPELYPLVQRLVKEGLLTSSIHVAPGGRRHRQFGLTRQGDQALKASEPTLWHLGGRLEPLRVAGRKR